MWCPGSDGMAENADASPQCNVVLTTLPSEAQAAAMARQLVEAGWAACVQIDAIRSIYRWRGEVCDEPEWRLTIKASRQSVPALLRFVRERHPYEVPEIVSLDIAQGDPAYVRWIAGDDQ